MGIVIGIDLGTTNSVVAVMRGESVEILADSFGRTVHASAICEDDGKLIFGDDAKYMATEGKTPLRFWKRHMGRGNVYPLLGEELHPEDLSRMLLEYLKEVAEEALGEDVDRAIITHPAFFGGDAIAATRAAGDGAGLNVGAKGLMMAPIAAALAYLHDDEDPMRLKRIMVYDLGGGTFDVSILERRHGVFVPPRFDGDPELGGYNFDKAIANHILKHLREQNYTITIDPDKPESDPRWAALMHIAEEVKIKLSEPGRAGLKADVRKPWVFNDDNGTNVRLRITVTRQEFEDMIEGMIDHTLALCDRALAKANVTPEEIDHAILIGGSSRLPIVRRKLEEKYNREFEFDDSLLDHGVAKGAALYAGADAGPVDGFILRPFPEKTSAPRLGIAGNVVAAEDVPDGARCVITLALEDDEKVQTANETGRFYFDVELKEDQVNEISLSAQTQDGREFAQRTIKIEHDLEAPDAVRKVGAICDIPPFLTKTLYVDTANKGLQPIIEEGCPLPVDVVVDLRVAGHESPSVRMSLYQEDQHLLDVVLTDFPVPVPEGTPVRVTVHVGINYSISAKAEIPSMPGFSREVQDVPIPQTTRPPVDEVRQHAEMLKKQFGDFLALFPDGSEKMKVAGEGDKIIGEIDALLEDADPDVFRCQRLLRNLERSMRQCSVENFQPSRQQMAELFDKAEELLAQAEGKDATLKRERLDETLAEMALQRDEAYRRRDREQWGSVGGRMAEIIARLEQITNPDGDGASSLPPAPILQAWMKSQVDELETEAAARGKAGDPQVAEAIRIARAELDAVDLSAKDAQSQLIRIYQGPMQRAEGPIGRAVATGHDIVAWRDSRESGTPYIPGGVTHRVQPPVISAPAARESGTPSMPGVISDRVQFAVTCPPAMVPGGNYVLDIWAYLERQRRQVIERAREEAAGGEIRIKSRGPIKVARGTVLTVRLQIQDLLVEPPEDTIYWEGEIGNATFAVPVPAEACSGPRHGRATIHIDGLQIARLAFIVRIDSESTSREALQMQQQRYRTAFASYASEDRDKVLGRVHGIQKGAPHLKVFLDVRDLRSGERWQARLQHEIVTRDIFYLFWSRAASRSKWVDWEWRCALRERGIDFIDPVPLASPREAPPPGELAEKLHFNDWVLAYMSDPDCDAGGL